ncbi:MAG: DUF6448 family protein [Phycisphaerae bacterium]|jgi:hypothetical protein
MKPKTNILTVAIATMVLGLAFPAAVLAQYDAMDGPIVKDAQAAISKGDVAIVLKWVPKANEDEVRKAFTKTMAVRNKGPDARDLADNYFFETVVRLYCQATNQLYTGLRPAGQGMPPEMTDADKALAAGRVDDLAKKISSAVETALRQRFTTAVEAQKQKDNSIEAGRLYASAYVQLVDFIGSIYQVIAGLPPPMPSPRVQPTAPVIAQPVTPPPGTVLPAPQSNTPTIQQRWNNGTYQYYYVYGPIY